MEVLQAIQGRRSVRRFQARPVERELLERLVEVASWAPSGGNAQTWHFVVVTEPDRLRHIKAVSPGHLGDPPAVIALCQDMEAARRKGGELGGTLAVMDSAMAAQNILLAAYDAGLGSCVIASFHKGAVGKLLGLPAGMEPVLLVSVGWPEQMPSPPPRRRDVVSFEVYGGEG
ncbi:nitroreductase family protein [Candidatus Bipolaricaulota bacterium]|nr:nitroreductase family protein [Candidatus Bipolaricaulota bacterium]